MSSPATSHPPLVTRPDDEVLVRVEGVSKKFCRSLKKSLWYGVCDIAGELLPGRKRRETRVESYQTDQLKISAARLWTLDSRPPPPSTLDPLPVTRHSLPRRQAKLRFAPANSSPSKMCHLNFAGGGMPGAHWA
jgi:hypothetical protein